MDCWVEWRDKGRGLEMQAESLNLVLFQHKVFLIYNFI